MNTFFKILADVLVDRQEMRLTVKKIGTDLVVSVVPNFKQATQNMEMTGTPEDMDANFLNEIKKPAETKTEFTSTSTEDGENKEEDVDHNEGPKKSSKKKDEPKKNSKKPVNKPKAEEKKEVAAAPVVKAPEGPTPKEKFTAHMAEGDKLFAEKKYAESEVEYQHAVDIFPNDRKAGNELNKSKQWARAVSILNK